MRAQLLVALLLLQQAPDSTTGVVSGTVLYSDGTPAAAQILRLVPVPEPGKQPAFVRPMSTNENGNYQQRVAPGRYFIRTNDDNPTYYPGVPAQDNATPILVSAGSITSGLNFSLPPSASGVRVQGRVTLPQGYPVATSRLLIMLDYFEEKPLAADGTFEFTHVMPGTYPLAVSAPGAQPIALTVSDRDITGIAMTVPPLTPVQGNVSIEGNGARPRFRLLMEGFFAAGTPFPTSSDGPYRTSVTSAADGSFSTTLPPGEYRVTAANLPAGTYIKGITANSKDLLGSSLRIEPAVSPVRILVTVGTSSGVRVAGRVKRSEADKIEAPERIVFHSAASGEVQEAPVTPEGSFEFPRLMPGNYYARVMVTPTIASQPTPIIIANRNTTDLEIPAPGARDLLGKVVVDGSGPPPRFTLLLARDPKSVVGAGPQGQMASIPLSMLFNSIVAGGAAGVSVLQLDVNALPDGSFSVRIPDGEYWVAATPTGLPQVSNGIPTAYFVRSITSNSSDLMTEPLRVSEKETAEIHIGFGTTAPNPWVRVSGRINGWDASRGGPKVALDSSVTSTIETFVDAEGKFEFPVVLQRTGYTARLVPPDDAASTPHIEVEETDVTNVEITAPAKREVIARIAVEGNSPVPSVGLSLRAKDSSMVVVIRPGSDGTARIKLPVDERRVSLTGLPMGYDVRSATYGATDLIKQPLNVGESAASELNITLTQDLQIPLGSLRGRVRGLDPEKGSVRLVLNGVTAFARFEVDVNADGSFNFTKLPQGSYTPSLEGGAATTNLTPSSITISGPDLVGIELATQVAGTKPPGAESRAKGATLTDFGLSGRASANESAAVANVRTINTAQVTYLSISNGRYGSLNELIGAGLLDESFKGVKAGFNYSIVAFGSDYAAAAIPANSATGRYGFYALPDAVVRYSAFEQLAPPQQATRPVQ